MSTDEFTRECIFPSLPRTTRGLPLMLSGSPDGTKFLYCSGNSVFIRDAAKINDCEVYTEHTTLTTVAKYAPSGFYIASGDNFGKIRLWDTTQTTHILKAEYAIINGPIRDIAWSEDSKRLAVVGEGRERFGHVFLFDTGTSNGNLSGQSKTMTSIDFRWARPYRLVSGSEDNTVAIFEGPPFKFKTLFHEHTRFVQCVRYNKNGSIFASAGADGKVYLFEGSDGTKIGELTDPECNNGAVAHDGGVLALSWDPNGNQLVTASGDKTLKIWNVPDRQLLSTITFENTIENQQLGVVWLKDLIISISLSGFINYIDPETRSTTKVLKGHNKSITALTVSKERDVAFTGDFEGNITRWKIPSGSSERLVPAVHKSQISGLKLTDNGLLISLGWDDTISFTKTSSGLENVQPTTHKLSSQPRGLDCTSDGKKVAVACHRSIVIFMGEKQSTQETKYEGTCASLHPNGSLLAVGGTDAKIHIYNLSESGVLDEKKTLQQGGAITSVNFSPNGKHLVATDVAKKVVPYAVDGDFKIASEKSWSHHTARINCSAWSSNSRFVATGSLDTNIMIWDLEQSGEHPVVIRAAHPTSAINGVVWLAENKLLSVGQDANTCIWTVKL